MSIADHARKVPGVAAVEGAITGAARHQGSAQRKHSPSYTSPAE